MDVTEVYHQWAVARNLRSWLQPVLPTRTAEHNEMNPRGPIHCKSLFKQIPQGLPYQIKRLILFCIAEPVWDNVLFLQIIYLKHVSYCSCKMHLFLKLMVIIVLMTKLYLALKFCVLFSVFKLSFSIFLLSILPQIFTIKLVKAVKIFLLPTECWVVLKFTLPDEFSTLR